MGLYYYNKGDNMAIKFYGINDLATTFYVEEASKYLETFDSDVEHTINEIICLENCLKYIDYNIFPDGYGEARRALLKKKSAEIRKIIGCFWNGITTITFWKMPMFEQAYHKDFLENFEKYKLKTKIPRELFWKIIKKNNIELRSILNSKNLVGWLDSDIREILINKPFGTELLVEAKLVYKENDELFLPKSLTQEDIDKAVASYIDHGNINLVKVISESSIEMGVSDKTRLKAKRKYEKYVEEYFKKNGGVEFGIKTQIIKDQAVPFIVNTENNFTSISFSERYFLKNMKDEASIFKILRTSFGLVDRNYIMCLPSYRSELGVFERFLLLKGKKHYPDGISFQVKDQQTMSGLMIYEKFLHSHNKCIEDIVAWFFNIYLNKYLNTNGFHYSKSTSSTFYEKAKNLFTEIDAVVRQYRMFVDDGRIDEELLELSSTPVDFCELSSFNKGKYYYLNTNKAEADTVLNALFSDQSHLNYIDEARHDVNLFSLIANKDMKRDDFLSYQKPYIDWLSNLGFLKVDENGKIEVTIYAWIFGFLYRVEAIPYYSYNEKIQKDITKLTSDGWLVPSNHLFTISEIEYSNYILNRKQFTNGLDLRNKYVHGSKSLTKDERDNELAYTRGLMVMVSLMIKIYDDLQIYFLVQA